PYTTDGNGNPIGRTAGWAYNNGYMDQARKGIFHYALTFPGPGGQNGYGVTVSFGHGSLIDPAHEFGHSLGLQHFRADSTDSPELNCKPNYPSIMNYAPPASLAFSDGYGRPALDDVNLTEKGAVDVSTARGAAYLARLRDDFNYNVNPSAGDVDWN